MLASLFGILFLFVLGVAVGIALASLYWRRTGSRCRSRFDGRPPWHCIAVPIVDRKLPEAALRTAARLSAGGSCDLVILVPVQVPRTMNVDAAALPGLESAIDRLETAEAFVRNLGAPVHGEVLRGREIGDIVGRACAEAGVEAVVVQPDTTSRATSDLVRALVDPKSPGRLDIVIAQQPLDAATTKP